MLHLNDRRRRCKKTSSILWTPANLTNLELWLDASDSGTITKDGSNKVSQWDDKSGNGNHATQGTEANQPAYNAADNSVNFDGSNDWMQLPPNVKNSICRDTNHSIFIVFKADNPSSSIGCMFLTSSPNYGNNSLAYQIRASHIRLSYYEYYDTSGDNEYRSAPFTDTTEKHFMSITHAANTLHDAFLDGTEITGTERAYRAQLSGCRIGSAIDNNRFFDGDMFEIIIADSVLSEADRQKIEGYLAHEWDVENSLPAGHPYKSSPPYV
ncbi:MAG: hypothetical protein U9P90_02255 [Patescibacteria group bacterium]|nr:hypothetical protein [Patescibacteria group bacterium]